MVITNLFKCLSDQERARIIGLLITRPLCVCHLLEVLECDPITMSKKLAYMKKLGILEVVREKNWKIYSINESYLSLARKLIAEIAEEAADDLPIFADREKCKNMMMRLEASGSGSLDALSCC